MAKSYRTAFIRVTGENDTEKGKIVYNKKDIENVLLDWSSSASLTYWFIEHSADEEVSKLIIILLLSLKVLLCLTL